MYVNMTDVAKIKNDITIHGIQAEISNSSLIFQSTSVTVMRITIKDMTIKNTIIHLTYIDIKLFNCILFNTLITDVNLSTKSIHSTHQVQITVKGCKIICTKINNQIHAAIRLHTHGVVSLSVTETSVQNCYTDIFAYNLMLSFFKCHFIETSIRIKVKSYVKVPSFLHFKRTKFLQALSDPKKIDISLHLHNPYLHIEHCYFNGTSVEVISPKMYFPQSLFYIKLTHSSFNNANKHGDGGALFLSSNVKNSAIILIHSFFIGNECHKLSGSRPGKGGAIFVEGSSISMSIIKCAFIDNFASESGTSLFSTYGVSLYIKGTFFSMEITIADPNSIVSSLGNVHSLEGKFKVIKQDPNLPISSIPILSIEILSKNLNISVSCPQWYQQLMTYQRETVGAAMQRDNENLQALTNLLFHCTGCMEGFHTSSNHRESFLYQANGSNLGPHFFSSSKDCVKCPYGAECSGNNVIPRPNYWGRWYESELMFHQCPAGYCCTGSVNGPCETYKSCAGNRTGTLCGSCKNGFSLSILTGKCTLNSECGGKGWFWLLVIFATMTYALWYTFKDDILELTVFGMYGYLLKMKAIVSNINMLKERKTLKITC